MAAEQGDVEMLEDPVAKALLESRQLARLAYTWSDGTPRVVPIWFHWNGDAIVMGTPVRAPKLKAFPYRALLVRGTATVEMLDTVAPEYVAAARRYFGDEQGDAWVTPLQGQPMARVSVTPSWVTVLDFETRFPSALSA